MVPFLFANNFQTTLAANANSGATTLSLAASAGIPTIPVGSYLPMFLRDAATNQLCEVVYVTAASGATMTVIRAQEGTTAQNWSVGDYAIIGPTAGSIQTISNELVNVLKSSNRPPSLTQSNEIVASLQAGGFTFCTDNGTAGTYVLTTVLPSLGGYATGMKVRFFARSGPNTGPCTLAYSGGSAVAFISRRGDAFAGGEIIAGQMVEAVYNGTAWQATNTAAPDGVAAGVASGYLTPTVSNCNTAPLGWSQWNNTAANAPVAGSYGNLFTESNVGSNIAASGNSINQIGVTTANQIWYRQNVNNGGWSAWRQFLDVATAQASFAPYGLFSHVVAYLAGSYNFIVPTGVTYVRVTVVGGGGGGGGAQGTGAGQCSAAAGGGGAGWGMGVYSVTPGQNIPVTVGYGGAGGNGGGSWGGSGGTSSFGSLLSAPGGGGGPGCLVAGAINIIAGGAGGGYPSGAQVGGGGDGGGVGIVPSIAYDNMGGSGGNSLFGGGATNSTNNNAGTTGNAYGAGGSGANCQPNSGGDLPGGNGAGGVVIVEW